MDLLEKIAFELAGIHKTDLTHAEKKIVKLLKDYLYEKPSGSYSMTRNKKKATRTLPDKNGRGRMEPKG